MNTKIKLIYFILLFSCNNKMDKKDIALLDFLDMIESGDIIELNNFLDDYSIEDRAYFLNNKINSVTPLELAVWYNDTNMANFLLSYNVFIDELDLFKRSALMVAIENNNTEVAILLLNKGANPYLKSNYYMGFDPFLLSVKYQNKIIFDYIIKKDIKKDNLLKDRLYDLNLANIIIKDYLNERQDKIYYYFNKVIKNEINKIKNEIQITDRYINY